MKITNKYNLPEPVVKSLSHDSYDRGKSNRSVTQLIDSPRISVLRRQHDEEMSEDVSQKLWSVLGTAVHNMFEKGAEDTAFISEQRWFTSHDGGWRISGAIDLVEVNDKAKTSIVSDYKSTSVWSVIYEKQEWHNQLNAYAWLLRHTEMEPDPLEEEHRYFPDYTVNKLQIIAVLRDWKENDLKRNGGNYPKAPIMVIDIPTWSPEEQDRYMEERIALHDEAEYAYLTGGRLPACSEKEQWAKPEKFALHKGTAKRATRVFDDLSEAQKYMKGTDLTLVRRAGDKTRCTANWCGVNEWCDQYEKESK